MLKREFDIKNIFLKLSVLNLMLLMVVYMLNSFQEVLISTYIFQLSLLVLACLSIMLFWKKKVNIVVIVSFFLSVSMLISSLYFNNSISWQFLLSKTFLCFFTFVLGYLFKYSSINKKSMDVIICITAIALFCIYINNVSTTFGILNKDYVKTSIYYLICLVPLIFSISNKFVKSTLIISIFIMTLISFKRSAIIVLLSMLIVIVIVDNIQLNFKNKIKPLFCFCTLLFVILYFAMKYNDTDISDIEDIIYIWLNRFNSGSGRDNLIMMTMDLQKESSAFEWIFGHGYNATMLDSPYRMSSHCDYVEIVYNYGMVTAVLFLVFIALLVQIAYKKIRTNSKNKNTFISALIIFLLGSLPSHMITYSTYYLLLSFSMGYSLTEKN